MTLSEQSSLVYVIGFEEDRAFVEVAFVARGEPGWNAAEQTFQPWQRPPLPDSTGYLTGVGVGRLFFQYEPKARVAWIDVRRLPVRRGTVVVVDESHTLPPVIASVTQVNAALAVADVCAAREKSDHEVFRRAVLTVLMQDPELRRILAGSSQ